MQTQTDDRLAGTRQRKADEDPEAYARHVHEQQAKVDLKAERIDRLFSLIRDARVVMPDVVSYDFETTIRATWDCADAQTFRAVLRAIGSTIDNPWHKQSDSGSYRMRRRVDGLELTVRATWVTCEQVQVGTKVESTIEVVEPAKTRTVVGEVPVYEWRCPDSALLSELADGQETVEPAEIGAG